MKPWILLFVAGLLETAWAVGLKYTDAFTRLWPSVWTIVALIASMVFLAIAVRDLPIGTAYPIWVGIGAIGAALFGILALGESTSPTRILFLLLLVVAIVGLKSTSASATVENFESQEQTISIE
jgi:quaternary ammonium compound-resistance protein SugE